MSLFLLASAVALFLAQGQPAAEQCVLAGKVVDSVTGAPLRRATVTLKETSGKHPQSLETGADGEFRFEDLAPGGYRVAAKRPGYVEQEYGARRYKQRAEEIRLGRGERKTDLVVRLIPPGTIRGRVFDEDIEPMPGVAVTVVRRIYSGGRWQLEQAGSATTDPLGEYVVRDLQPGRYYVKALHRSQSIVFSENPGEPLYGYAPAYHPNAPDSASAVAVQVSAGGEMRGVDIQLRKIRLLRLRGKVIRGDTGKPEPEAQVTLGDMTANSIAFITGQYYAVSDTKGEFEIIG